MISSQRSQWKAGIVSFVRHTDWLLLLSCAAATTYGLLLVYSAAVSAGSSSRDYLIQVAAAGVGLIAAVIISRFDYEYICRLWPVWAGVALLLVLITFTPLGMTVADDKAWIAVPIIGTFQPSELLKIAFIITFSVHLSQVHDRINELKVLVPVGLHGAVPIGLVFLQGDDGTALVFLCIFVSMMFIAGLRPLYFILAATAMVALVPLVWTYMDEDKKARFLSLLPQFVNQYKGGIGWQQYWALVAIGSGQLTGVGYLQGGNNVSLYARNNDLVFTVAAEEFGFIGSLALLAVLMLVVLALLRGMTKARDLQGSLICGGIMAMIGFQSLINIGMNVRLLPVIGITLPFFSRGGSSLATLFLGIGLALSVYQSSGRSTRDTIFRKRVL